MTLAHSISDLQRRLSSLLQAMSLGLLLRWVVSLVLLMAVASKCVSPGAITAVASYLLGGDAGHRLVVGAVAALVTIESALALALITGVHPRMTGIVAASFFACLTLVLIRLSVDAAAPHCACMGAVHGGLLGESPGQSFAAGLIRNVGLIMASVMIARGGREGARS